jgi:hypothetical protein
MSFVNRGDIEARVLKTGSSIREILMNLTPKHHYDMFPKMWG